MAQSPLNAPLDDPSSGDSSPNVSGAAENRVGDAGLLRKIVRFEELARCGDEVWIEHAGQLYRLRRTRHGKLILTK